MKAMNSKAKPIHVVIENVTVKFDSWSRNANFSMASMDDFKMILCMKLLCKVKMVPISHL